MTPAELGKALRCELFADRGTNIKESLDYALNIAQASDNPQAVTTAVFVVVNTIANTLIEMGETQ